ncbi:MAG TPA: hypothetical protein VFW19_16695 [Allosphingosinicella sp.]|nr:hypothetical protein [Allosphingosinicella sp.]
MLRLLVLTASTLLLTAANIHGSSRRSERVLPIGASFDWDSRNPHLVHLRAGKLHVSVFSRLRDGVTVPMVRVTGGSRSILFRGYDRYGYYPGVRVSVGRWDRQGHPFIMLEQDTGGTHCCLRLQVLVADRGRLAVTDLGEWDGTTPMKAPKDLDGDGRPDLVLKDERRFLEEFGSHSESWSPPLILNIVKGRAVDVSARRAFAALFLRDMKEARRWCFQDPLEGDLSFNGGACAGYAASAARAGHFGAAWKDIVRLYGRDSLFSLSVCKGKWDSLKGCSAYKIGFYRSFPDGVRAYLKMLGYIRR